MTAHHVLFFLRRLLWVLLAAYAPLQAAAITTTQSTTRSTPAVSFAAAARDVTAYIQKTYCDPTTGLYAHSTAKREPEAMWGNGVMFSALVAAAREEPKTYGPVLAKFFAAMDRYWDAKAKIPGYEPWPTRGDGNDKYYDDNEWMVLAFLDAYDLTGDVRYLDRADQALAFALSGWDAEKLGGGIWWHEGHKDDCRIPCSNAPAAVACLRMARYRRREQNIEWARKIVAWTNAQLQADDGLFFDRKRVTDGKIGRARLTYNAGLMLRANLGLHRLTGEATYLDEAKRIAAACEWFVDRKTGAYRDNVKFAHLLVEADLEFSRATGDERSLARARRNGEVAYEKWKANPPSDLIEEASISRMLWLLAGQAKEAGKKAAPRSQTTTFSR